MTAQNGSDATRGMAAAREGRQTFPKRFYSLADIARTEVGFALRLDGRQARTPGRNLLVVPTAELAEALAAEWNGVAEVIDPRQMPLTRLVNTAIDGVCRMLDAVIEEVVRFAGSDLVVYRATEPPELRRAQASAWDDLIAWSRDGFDAPLRLGQGVVFVEQPADSMARLATAIRSLVGGGLAAPYRAGALHVMTTLTGSALIAIAVAVGRITPDQAWAAAHVDEDYQISLWGEDREASERRAARWEEMRAAALLFSLAG